MYQGSSRVEDSSRRSTIFVCVCVGKYSKTNRMTKAKHNVLTINLYYKDRDQRPIMVSSCRDINYKKNTSIYENILVLTYTVIGSRNSVYIKMEVISTYQNFFSYDKRTSAM